MNIALLGLPQAGKRTLFKLLTGRNVKSDRKPSEVVEGIAPIRDSRVDSLDGLYKPKSRVYAENHFVLCPDAVTDGSSHDWLAAAEKCDLLCLVVRAFDSEQVYHPLGSVDPERDIANLKDELLLADLQLIEKRLERIGKESRSGLTTPQKLEQQALGCFQGLLEGDRRLSDCELDRQYLDATRHLSLLTLKPIVVVYNVSEDSLASPCASNAVVVSCLIEQEISELESPEEQLEYMETIGLESSGVDRVNQLVYQALGLMSFYTVGKDECRAWTIRRNSTAPVAAGKIHSDIQRGFIRVEVIKYDDLMQAGSEQAVKDQGKVQTKGKDYVIEDGDICHFLFNV